MNPLLKTPPGRSSKCSCSMARSMRAPILVTLETSSSESSFFSRAVRNLSPKSPTWPCERLPRSDNYGNIIGQPGGVRHSQESKVGVTGINLAGDSSADESNPNTRVVLYYLKELCLSRSQPFYSHSLPML